MQVASDQFDKFLSGGYPFKGAGKIGSGGDRMLFLHAPHLHTEVMCFNDNGDTQWFQGILDAILDLGGQPFLYL